MNTLAMCDREIKDGMWDKRIQWECDRSAWKETKQLMSDTGQRGNEEILERWNVLCERV